MATQLRAVLNAFEDSSGALSMTQLSRELGIAPATLDSMITYWVRKGRLRESAQETECGTCGSAKGCPFIMKMPRRYELVNANDPPGTPPPCSCCG